MGLCKSGGNKLMVGFGGMGVKLGPLCPSRAQRQRLPRRIRTQMSALTLAIVSLPASAATPYEMVDPRIGTANEGQTYPVVGMPFGMTGWTPETRATEDKCVSPYYYNDSRITGFRGSHWLSGSCTQDYGSVTLMPTTEI